MFGMMVLITSYIHIVDRFVNFQSWQAIVKYGSESLSRGNTEDFKSLVKFGFVLDISTAFIGQILTIVVVFLIGKFKMWDTQFIVVSFIYSITILFHINGTPTAILRLFDKYTVIAFQKIVSSSLKLLFSAVAFILNADLKAFIIIWAASDIVGNIALVIFAQKAMVSRGMQGFVFCSLKDLSKRFEGIWKFVWASNIHASVKLGLKEIDVVIVGHLLGLHGAGIYKVVKSIGTSIGSFTGPLYQVIYPELAKNVETRNYVALRRLIINPLGLVSIVSVALFLLFILFGETAITMFLGIEYIISFHPAQIYLIGTLLSMVTFSFHPTLLSLGKATTSLYILLFSTFVYLVSLVILTNAYGLAGSSLSFVFFYVVWSTIQGFTINTCLKRSLL